MDIILVMFVGVFVGKKVYPNKYKKINEKAQGVFIILLIFLMGLSLGKNPYFTDDLMELGGTSFLYAMSSIVFSVISVKIFCKKLEKKGKET